jgi:hypothetical protein
VYPSSILGQASNLSTNATFAAIARELSDFAKGATHCANFGAGS